MLHFSLHYQKWMKILDLKFQYFELFIWLKFDFTKLPKSFRQKWVCDSICWRIILSDVFLKYITKIVIIIDFTKQQKENIFYQLSFQNGLNIDLKIFKITNYLFVMNHRIISNKSNKYKNSNIESINAFYHFLYSFIFAIFEHLCFWT